MYVYDCVEEELNDIGKQSEQKYVQNISVNSLFQEQVCGGWFWNTSGLDETWVRVNSIGNLDWKSPSEKDAWYAQSEKIKVYWEEKAWGTNSKNDGKQDETRHEISYKY